MNIRTRLLASFVSIALLVLVIFGIVAYRIAEEAAARQDALTLQYTIEEVALMLAPRLQPREGNAVALDEFRLPLLQRTALLIVHDGQGNETALGNSRVDAFGGKRSLLALIKGVTGPHSGQLDLDDERYSWASVPIPGTLLRLTAAQPAITAQFATLKTLGLRMLVTAGVVIWVAVWGALIITSILTRHLRTQNARLVHQALHDELTDLPNRTLLYDRLDQALHRAHRENQPMALFLMDLDRFKEVNDTLGHHFGDHVLQAVGKRVVSELRETDTIARLGGDEFAVLLPDTDADDAVLCAEKLLTALEAAIPVSGMSLSIKTSIGIALYPLHGHDAETLLQHADVAMYQAKRANTGFRIYEQEQDPNSIRRLTMTGEMRDAILGDQLVLHYQPKVNLKEQRVVGVEALVRWQHPKLGLLPPEEFIPLAEHNGLIGLLTDWVLQRAIAQCRDWQARGIQLRMGVNLSAHSLHNLRLPDQIAGFLDAAGLPPHLLDIELTESAMMSDMHRAKDVFGRLSAMGVRLAIDDFGTGMSSLSYLKRLPVNELKIDKSFVIDMAEDEDNAVLVRSIIDLSHNIGRSVVAEGVQDREVLQLLEMLGCDTAQGYFISRPCSAEDLEIWLQGSPWGIRSPATKVEPVAVFRPRGK